MELDKIESGNGSQGVVEIPETVTVIPDAMTEFMPDLMKDALFYYSQDPARYIKAAFKMAGIQFETPRVNGRYGF